jgi:hypothetical protein
LEFGPLEALMFPDGLEQLFGRQAVPVMQLAGAMLASPLPIKIVRVRRHALIFCAAGTKSTAKAPQVQAKASTCDQRNRQAIAFISDDGHCIRAALTRTVSPFIKWQFRETRRKVTCIQTLAERAKTHMRLNGANKIYDRIFPISVQIQLVLGMICLAWRGLEIANYTE